MHKEAYAAMAGVLAQEQGDGLRVLDVGSLDVNGTYRPLIEARGWSYTGLDIRPGPNVDVVTVDPYHYPLQENGFDIVLSGSTMEHVAEIWRWAPELARVLKPGGLLVILTHHCFPLHRYPADYWRIMPDGMGYLFDMCGSLTEYDIEMVDSRDILATARKKAAL